MITREDKIKAIAMAICEIEYFGFDPESEDEETGFPLWETFRESAVNVLNTLETYDE